MVRNPNCILSVRERDRVCDRKREKPGVSGVHVELLRCHVPALEESPLPPSPSHAVPEPAGVRMAVAQKGPGIYHGPPSRELAIHSAGIY